MNKKCPHPIPISIGTCFSRHQVMTSSMGTSSRFNILWIRQHWRIMVSLQYSLYLQTDEHHGGRQVLLQQAANPQSVTRTIAQKLTSLSLSACVASKAPFLSYTHICRAPTRDIYPGTQIAHSGTIHSY